MRIAMANTCANPGYFHQTFKSLLALLIVFPTFFSICISQTVTFSANKVPLKEVMTLVEKQTGYFFVYNEPLIADAPAISISAKNLPLQQFLKKVFEEQSIEFSIKRKTILLSKKIKQDDKKQFSELNGPIIRGTVKARNGLPLQGINITVKGSQKGTVSKQDGHFAIDAGPGNIIVASSIGYQTAEFPVISTAPIEILLATAETELEQIVFKGYYSETRLTSTGSVGKITSEDIEKQPVGNSLLTLQGRIPGVVISTPNGLPGSDVKMEVRGRNFLSSGSQPLYVVDGVPFNSQPIAQQGVYSPILGTQSPFTSINPGDIEKIEILKDADATAIYGSRGGNGVVLITTKKGVSGKTKFDVNVYSGAGAVANKVKMLSTEQYLQMRKEALKNDGIVGNEFNAPDLFVWDQNRYTDWHDKLIGGTAEILNTEASISGGNEYTRFLIRGGYREDGTVFPGEFKMKRTSALMTISHSSADQKFDITASANYSSTTDRQSQTDLTQYINFAPNYPIYDDDGKFYWGGNLNNPIATIKLLKVVTDNLVSRINARYRILKDLSVQVSAGYNRIAADEVSTNPSISLNPMMGMKPFSKFSNSANTSYIIEPQVNYAFDFLKGRVEMLAGATFQSSVSKGTVINAYNYSDDDLLEIVGAASDYNASAKNTNYKYQSVFSRLNYSYKNTYVINATFRRDGSSRFGINNRFGNFGAVGAGWIFSNEKFAADLFPFINYGKLRASYGVTGSDQIEDYLYLSTWQVNSTTYEGITGYNPEKLFNPDLQWESVKKMEAAVELGFVNNRINFTAGYYHNIAGNQLVAYQLPDVTGFPFIYKNFDARVRNSGWELSVNTINIDRLAKRFQWKSSFNITFPQNRLTSYEGLQNSPYRYDYVVGKSLNTIVGYKFFGVDPKTGRAILEDINKDGVISFEGDRQPIGSTDPKFYGGIQNELTWKQISLDFFFQFVNGRKTNYLSLPIVGDIYNQPEYAAMQRWTKENDQTKVPGATSSFISPRYSNFRNYISSDAMYTSNSFVRLKTVSLSFTVPGQWLSKAKIEGCRVYVNAQNLLTITPFKSLDPETGWLMLPQLRTITAGVLVNL